MADDSQKTFYLETFGCQMNAHDSEKVVGTLVSEGYRQVPTVEEAGLVLYNTCSIRDKAEQKVFNRLADYKKFYKQGKRFGVLGCVAQQEGEKIFERAPYVSLVCGSASYRNLPQMLVQIEAGKQRVTGLDDRETDECFETEFTRPNQSASRLHHHHRRLRQILRLLRGAVHARQGAQPDVRVGFGGSSADGRSGLYRDPVARAEREFLQGSGREEDLRGIAGGGRRNFRAFGACASPPRIRETLAATLSTRSTPSRRFAITCICRCRAARRACSMPCSGSTRATSTWSASRG